jgi:hypothetical protein
VPAGAFGCWKRGISETWRADIGRELSADEQAAVRDHLAAMAKAREAEQAAARKKARAKAAELWGKASPQVKVKHPYLLAKKVRAYGLRQLQANLFVPVYLRGELAGLQIIAPDGSKKFLTGTQKAGAFLEIEGAPDAPDVTVIAEGHRRDDPRGNGLACRRRVRRRQPGCSREGRARRAAVYDARPGGRQRPPYRRQSGPHESACRCRGRGRDRLRTGVRREQHRV